MTTTVVFPEPLTSIDPATWLIFSDFLLDSDDHAGAARARRIAETLASGRTGLWLTFTGTRNPMSLSGLHWFSSTFQMAETGQGRYSWHATLPAQFAGYDGVDAINPLLHPLIGTQRPDVARAFFDKLAELGPFLWGTPSDSTVTVPREVATCPECGGEVRAVVYRFNPESGEPQQTEVECDSFRWSKKDHHWHIGWQPVRDAVQRWARDNIRIREDRPT